MSDVPPWDPDATGPEYQYVRFADHVQALIEAAELRPGARLSPERELAAEYGVAYHTVRRAMVLLRERGLIVTVHGRGTFVKGGPLTPGDYGSEEKENQ